MRFERGSVWRVMNRCSDNVDILQVLKDERSEKSVGKRSNVFFHPAAESGRIVCKT